MTHVCPISWVPRGLTLLSNGPFWKEFGRVTGGWALPLSVSRPLMWPWLTLPSLPQPQKEQSLSTESTLGKEHLWP